MNQRFTLDRKSFEQFLAAICLLQRLRQQAKLKNMAVGSSSPLTSLLQLQGAINSGTVDIDWAMSSVLKLVLPVVAADAAGIWLFRSAAEFSCCARVGEIRDPERLGVEVLSHVADPHPVNEPYPSWRTPGQASRYPGYPNSVAVAPLRNRGKVVGALAAFSVEFDTFTPRDHNNLQFLAGLLEQVIQKAIASGYREAVALEHSALVRLVDVVKAHLNELERRPQSRTGVHEAGLRNEPLCADVANPPDLPGAISSPTLQQAEEDLLPTGDDGRLADISIPGVGVRAALGDVREYTAESKPFFSRAGVQRCASGIARLTGRCRTRIYRAAATARVQLRNAATRAASIPGRVVWHRLRLPIANLSTHMMGTCRSLLGFSNRVVVVRLVGLPRLPLTLPKTGFSLVSKAAVQCRSWSTSLAANCRSQLGDGKAPLKRGLAFAELQMRSLRRFARHAGADLSARFAHQRMRMRIGSRRPRALLASTADAGDALQRAAGSLAEVVSYAGGSTLSTLKFVQRPLFRVTGIRLNKRALRKSASGMIVFAIMAVFLAMQARDSFHSEPVSAATNTPARPVAGKLSASLTQTTPAPAERAPTSHREITDVSAAESLHNLTRYEIRTLERAAEYGDDDAAFQLGMAYETGYYIHQSCSNAAHWVEEAAESGNPAAAYNLALRYRTGDGLGADASAAEHWIEVATAHKYFPGKAPTPVQR